MTAASDVPGPETDGAPRRGLRTKGAILFAVLTVYVVGAAALLVPAAFRVPEASGELRELIGAAAAVALLGLATFGAFLALFLGRLAQDLGRLQARALDIVRGRRGAPLPVARDDELGALTRSVNQLADQLEAHERDRMLNRLEMFHRERMSLLGAMAAGLAHEIGNPVAAITALAEAPSLDRGQLQAQTARLAHITRRMALASGARSREPAPLALNGVVEGIAALVEFDTRFRRVTLACRLDPALPLALGVEDDVVQLLFHLLTNAAEALEERAPAAPRIELVTRAEDGAAVLEVSDNGPGMDAATLARATEPFFTTKGAGRGSGLGLDACAAILRRAGGALGIASRPGEGTRVTCRFPPLPLQ